MAVHVCPHCKVHRIFTAKVSRDVVVVIPCPACHEWSVLFRNKVIPLSRRIIEQGSFEERKDHLAHVITEFLEAGVLPSLEGFAFPRQDDHHASHDDNDDFSDEAHELLPISDEEFQKFVRIDLKCIDNDAYFKRHFG